MKYLLDTNVLVEVLRGNQHIIEHLKKISPNECAVSVVSAFELYTGAKKATNKDREMSKVKMLLEQMHLLSWDDNSANKSAKIRANLEKKGTPIGAYDILIAGHCLSVELTLVSNNVKEFSRINELKLEDWK